MRRLCHTPIAALALVATLLVAVLATLVAAPPSARAADTAGLQRRLNALGCDAGPADGVAGDWTRSAVIRFQTRARLVADGDAGPVTRGRLYAQGAPRCDRRPVPAGSGSGRRLVVSQRQNWLWLVDAQGRVVAQGGVVDNPGELNPGTYRTGSYCHKAARIERNSVPDGHLWLDHFVRFAPCGFGFHRIPRATDTGEQIHPDYLLGTDDRESHGCIRLSGRLSDQVWRFTTRGTEVRVVTG